ncbi:MAG: hypothetical protein GY864_14155 [Desulfobacterales bacterium]|nr:hypothetical protein [Desulfobacterales bacterium]
MKKNKKRIFLLMALATFLLFPTGMVFAQGFTVDFSSATGFPVPGEPEKIQTNNVIFNLTNPLTQQVIQTIPANFVWRFDYNLIALVFDSVAVANGTTCDALPSLTVNVTDALTGDPIEGATVQAEGQSATTDSAGEATLTGLPASGFPVSVSADGYVSGSQTVTLECGDQESIGFSLLPVDDPGVIAGNIRIILTWGENPRDLDSHLTMYDDADVQQFHIYYPSSNNNNCSGAPCDPSIPAWLDVDDTSSYGPETITIQKVSGSFVPGTYIYSVYHYAGSSDIPSSEATVKVYQGDTLMGTFTPPSPGDTTVGDDWALRMIRIGINAAGDVSYSAIGEYYGTVSSANVE